MSECHWVWVRNDLRLTDNPAIYYATKNSAHAAINMVYVHADHQDRVLHSESEAKMALRMAHVKDLIARCEASGVMCHEIQVETYSDLPEKLLALLLAHQVTDLHFNKEHLVNEKNRDQQVESLLSSHGIRVHEYDANYLLPLGSIRKKGGGMYHVFTPYKKQMVMRLYSEMPQPLPAPDWAKESELDRKELISGWPVGEAVAKAQLAHFSHNNAYAQERDFPFLYGTSRLSPYLALGVLSARQCLQQVMVDHQGRAIESVWVSELIWREFYADLCFEYPRLVKNQAFKALAKENWPGGEELLSAWQKGLTGFPLVDAGMRQLRSTGWMHNRLRMITASFLCKLCLVDWRLGERFFMENLVDGDFASNNGGWQWSSSTGCDAAPYFRIFNPETQSKKFDPEGVYISTYVPELKGLPAKEIHNPSTEVRKRLGYPMPVIDYRESRLQSLSWHKEP